jgi:transglutaminase-like putative cysteine protease
MGTDTLTYSVQHDTILRYSDTVMRSYNEVRLRPPDRGKQRTLSFALSSDPMTISTSRVDYYGNIVHRVDVTTRHRELGLRANCVVQSDPVRVRPPSPWDTDELRLDPRLDYALPSPRVPLDGSTRTLLWEWCGEDRSFDALLHVADRIRTEYRYETGATTVQSSIAELLTGGAGVCQDFTHLFLAVARHAGWPARYVSGYVGPKDGEDTVDGQSHAWAEVCGPSGRWLGIDPTYGGQVGQHHVRLAVGRDYGSIAPHHGVFYGTAVASPPEVSVRVTRVDGHPSEMPESMTSMLWNQQAEQQQQE